jgi:hypothetical protein
MAIGLSLPAAAGAADPAILATGGASEISAYGGTRVWTQRSGDRRYVLMIQSGDSAPRRVPIKSAPEPLEPDLGRGSGSSDVAAVIRRCDARGDCDIHLVDLTTGRERAVRGASSDACREGGASVWGGSVAFVRRRFGSLRQCRTTGVVLRTKRGRARKVGGFPSSDDTDVNGSWFTAVSGGGAWRVFLVPRDQKQTVIVETSTAGNETGAVIGGPLLDGDHVYYGRLDYDNQEGRTQQSYRRRRAALDPGDAEVVGTRLSTSFGIDAGQIFYTNGLGVFRVAPSG